MDQPASQQRSLMEIGRNCWRIAATERFGVLIDAEAYYAAAYAAMERAQSAIYILGWEIHSAVNLRPKAKDGQSYGLLAVLERLTTARPDLRVYILAWDYSSIYSLERELLQGIKLGWLSNERIRFTYDAEHPLGGSHHQKIIVVDDQIAFSGGLDVTQNRWDEVHHHPTNSARCTPSGRPYMPFHDVQAVVDTDAAASIAELARERWYRATGEVLERPQVAGKALKVTDLTRPSDVVLPGCAVAISRTLAQFKLQSEVREVETFYQDALASARHYIYIENQYFTSQTLGRVLATSLEQEQGPEVVIVLPKKAGGWLEEQTMGALQKLVLDSLTAADRHGRLHVFYPDDERLGGNDYIIVHSKIVICDGTLLHIGSANLNNRSMGLDSECDLTVELPAAEEAEGKLSPISKVLAALLADHTGVERGEAEQALRAVGAVRPSAAIAKLQGKNPYKSLASKTSTPADALWLAESLVDLQIGDWERPATIERRLDHWGLLHEDFRRYNPLFDSRVVFLATVVFAALLAWLWAFTPLRSYLNWGQLRDYLGTSDSRMGVTAVMLGLYMLGGLLFVPLNLLIIVTASIFPLYQALALIVLGAAANAATGYMVGRLLHRFFGDAKWVGARSRKIMRRLRSGSIGSIVLIRILPVAPNSLINMTAGFCELPLVKFLLGTTVGILPGACALTFFQRSLLQLLREASWENAMIAVFILATMILVYVVINRRFSRYNEDS